MLQFPDVYPFERKAGGGDRQFAFRRTLTEMLKDLDRCWRCGHALNVAAMFRLREAGIELIRAGIQPDFTWLEDPGLGP